jgi:O-antigen ligase
LSASTSAKFALPAAPGRARLRFGLYAAHLLAAFAIAISNSLLGLAVLAFPWLRNEPALPAPARRPAALAAVYLLALGAAVLASPSPGLSTRSLSEVFTFATFFLALAWVRGERQVRWLLDAAILIGALLALSGLAQLAAGYGDLERRIRGPFSHYMTFAGFLLPLDLVLIARLLGRRREPAADGPTAWLDRPAVAWTALAAINLALFASLTRSAWLALAVALLGLCALVRPRLLLAAPVVAALFLAVAPVPMVARALSIADLRDESNYDRLCMAEAGLRMVGERPLLGIGPDLVKRLYPIYRHPSAPRWNVPHLHNAFLQVAAERGLPALGALLALLGGSALAAWRGWRRGGSAADVHLGALGALTAFAVAACFENNWGDTEVQRYVLFLLAVPFCLAVTEGEGA